MTRPGKKRILYLARHLSFARAAAVCGVNERTFSNWFHEAAPQNPRRTGPRPRPMPPKEELERVLAIHTNQETARHYHVGYKTLVRWLRDYNLTHRLFDQSKMHCLADAARELRVSRMALSNWFRQGRLPGAVKVNKTRVLVPRETLCMLKERAERR